MTKRKRTNGQPPTISTGQTDKYRQYNDKKKKDKKKTNNLQKNTLIYIYFYIKRCP
jgi:hypothetical protein